MILGGCLRGNKPKPAVALSLSTMPAPLKEECKKPDVRVGMDLRVALLRTDGALVKCARRHRDTVKFYTTVKSNFERK